MTTYTCEFCEQKFKKKLPAKNHLEKSHKREILESEARNMVNTSTCLYCYKSFTGSTELHLNSHIRKIITTYFEQYMPKSSSILSI